ncbi:MAG: hypothetical protein K0Q99_819 [Clostridia bacterium]|jgi:hypothetical protein|nr:hypothetical protein [Clostridia bacterium]
MLNLRYKQQKNLLLNEQQTEKEIRSDLTSKLIKYELRKQDLR